MTCGGQENFRGRNSLNKGTVSNNHRLYVGIVNNSAKLDLRIHRVGQGEMQ